MEGIKCVLLDIEGTVCPISFVKETLFPYALRALPHVLASQWDSDALAPYLAAFPADERADPATLQAHVEDLTRRDVKAAALKNLQGYLWEDGYASGAYATTLFADVVPALEAWAAAGRRLAIYSSGSVFAQKLLFGHVRVEGEGGRDDGESRKRGVDEVEGAEERTGTLDEPVTKARRKDGDDDEDAPQPEAEASNSLSSESKEMKNEVPRPTHARDGSQAGSKKQPTSISTRDFTHLFDGWYDTTNAGLKTESSSYSKIANELKYQPEEILFFSDNVKEVDAATQAGMKSMVVDRPGNAPLTDADKARLQVVDSFSEIRPVPLDASNGNKDEA